MYYSESNIEGLYIEDFLDRFLLEEFERLCCLMLPADLIATNYFSASTISPHNPHGQWKNSLGIA